MILYNMIQKDIVSYHMLQCYILIAYDIISYCIRWSAIRSSDTELYFTEFFDTIICYMMWYNIVSYYTIRYHIIWHVTISYCIMIQYCIIWYNMILYIWCHIIGIGIIWYISTISSKIQLGNYQVFLASSMIWIWS